MAVLTLNKHSDTSFLNREKGLEEIVEKELIQELEHEFTPFASESHNTNTFVRLQTKCDFIISFSSGFL